MTLVERTALLKERCTNLETLGEKIDEAASLGTRLGELRRLAEKLPDQIATIKMLREAGVSVDASAASLPRVCNAIAKIRGRFAQARQSASLTRGQDWNVLIRELPNVIEEFEEAASEGWKRHAVQLFAGDAPAAVERTLAPTDANKASLHKYRQTYERYVRLRTSTPVSPDDIGELARVAEELKGVEFDHKVSAAVRKFLEALPKGAPLTLLTDEVREWIEQQNLGDRYVVVPVSR